MQMNDIIDGLNSCDCSAGTQAANFNNVPGYGYSGCGFSWWIWILLILFYSNQGYGNARVANNCCCNDNKNDCCCCCGNAGYSNAGNYSGFGGYLFLLVILFLCNGCNGYGNNFYSGYNQGFDALSGCC